MSGLFACHLDLTREVVRQYRGKLSPIRHNRQLLFLSHVNRHICLTPYGVRQIYWHILCRSTLALTARHKGKALEQMHILFVLQQCTVQFGQRRLAVFLEISRIHVLCQQQFQPVQHFGG